MQQNRLYLAEQGLRITDILDIKTIEGQDVAEVLYEDDTREMVPATVVRNLHPQMMIDFFEARLRFDGEKIWFERTIDRNEAKLANERDQTVPDAKSYEEN